MSDASYQNALGAFINGRIKEAETLCKAIIKSQPRAHQAIHLLAMTEKRRNKFKLAIKTFKKALQLAPKTAMYWNNLGETYREMGDISSAADCYRKAIQYDSDFAEPHCNRGILFITEGNSAEAERELLRALEIAPNMPLALFNLGVLYTNTGSLNRARETYERVLAIDPNYTDALINLAHLASEEGNFKESCSLYRRATELEPSRFTAWLGLGYALLNSKQHRNAHEALKQAVRLDGRSVDAQVGLADTTLLLGESKAALEILERCRQIAGESPRLYKQLAKTYLSCGDFERAAAEARRCLELDGDNVAAHRIVGQTKRFSSRDDEDLQRMITLFRREGLRGDQRAVIAFAVGKAMEKIGDYDAAFGYFREGNRLQRAMKEYDTARTRRYVEALCELYDLTRPFDGSAGGVDDATPIFIVGMPRSGTSLVEQILSSHPKVEGAGELDDFELLLTQQCGVSSREKLTGPLAGLKPEAYRQIGEKYLAELRKRFPEAARITDKMPSNFFHLGAIRQSLPRAKIIHCRRDPVDTCLSIYQQLFDGIHPYAYELRELGEYYRLYEAVTAHWRQWLGEGGMYEVCYEKLVANQESETRALLEFCGLEFDPACMDFHKSERMVLTASVTQVRQPIYSGSVQRWRRYENHLGPLLEALEKTVS